MKHHEREFFISMIRCGKLNIEYNDILLVIKPLSIDQGYEASIVYDKAYKQAMIDGIMSEDEITEWMFSSGLWTDQDEEKSEGFRKDIEKLKIEIYNNREDKKLREQIRLYLRVGEKQFAQHLKEKTSFYQNTREGYALSEKVSWIIKNCTYHKDKLYDFKKISLNYVVDEWQNSILSESSIRELAREEPWKSIWSIRTNSQNRLFNPNDGYELTTNQKHLVLWSQIYDNIQESLDCPNEDVIKDDDLLDGWFLVQAKKREKERLEKEFEKKHENSKIKESEEVFIVANPKDKSSINKINSMNDPRSNMIKKQRMEVINNKGGIARQHDFLDEKQKMQMEITNSMRNKLTGGR